MKKQQTRHYACYKGRDKRVVTVVGIAFVLLGLVFLFLPSIKFSGYLLLMMAGACFLWMVLDRYAEYSKIVKVCKWIYLVSVGALLAVLLGLETLVLVESGGDDPDTPVSAVIVLGAGVNGETPSPALQTRIDAAAEYLLSHPEVPAVLSGGKGPGERISEAEAMRRGLLARGVDGERLLLEEQSTSTAENFDFSAQVLAQEGVDVTDTIAVVSNDFHLFRAKLIASRTGMVNMVGIPAELPWWWLSANYYIREAFATVKVLLF